MEIIIDSFISNFKNALALVSYFEFIAVILSIIYLLLAIKQNAWGFLAAFISTLIYSIIFFDATLFMSSLLNAYYLLMAIYGFYSWKKGFKNSEELKVSSLKVKTHFILILSLTILSIIIGYIMDNYTNASFAYLDSFITIFALCTTYLLAKKILENWIYWIVIDSSSIYLYYQKDLFFTSFLFLIYTILATFAYFSWRKNSL
ncbi:Nicotinamide riboside transporter PnuC [Aliarcobacter thereius]|uniref:Nicotinamide riboside transporter PnuC n=2 Tax=Aliarcobacter thereius TaxID=544718 RepID=A0A1C0B663_9BACT|nr:nicotinamide riboside transporter PnuC [Aliarcobacter thereius]OCL86319.1 Nicotinamide riboside transporter PnuC [Aliarcobacter thereius]OCL96397.1 Nicotinamide riboside transporter PnuC [Aliarcobacter thereius LMG 24486]OCL98642.1 Nicotinamide riboside transporter PnuC [Aliarcobacter thereius]QBF15642.1 nicotinamide mononucleotide transporter [Aliarcobacter thereius LMG 24486]TLS71499.1 nicotinamide mononucleotide transporter [Aliarcobacter thereius]